MTKKISGAEYPLSKIFSSEFEYHIPSYQRPFAWTIDQASELFDDLYSFFTTEDDEGYFLGSIVLIKTEGRPHSEVIDGQQRLTTLTLLLSTICSSVPDEAYRSQVEKYINEPGNEPEGLLPVPRLSTRERDRSFFKNYVHGLRFEELLSLEGTSLANESQRNIQNISKDFLRQIETRFGGDVAALKRFVNFLVTRCFLVAVSTPNQQSAFRVFSVMNSRGLDLQATDIIKADTIGQISEDQQDHYNERWEDMETELGRSGFNDLFSYVRMIFAKEKAKKALLEEFREHVLKKVSSPEALLEDILEPYASALSIAKSSSYQASAHADVVNIHLRWLNRIDNSDWIPVAILFLSQHRDRPEYVAWFFQKLERLAAYLHICSKNVNERIARYSQIIAALEGDHSAGHPVEAIELTPDEIPEMKVALDSNIYEMPVRRRNFLILRLDAFMSDGGASYDPTVLTIEHVLPQTVAEGSKWAELWPREESRQEWVHRIANLVPLNRRRNSQAQNYDFETKKAAYFTGKNNVSSYALTTQVLHTQEWSEDHLRKRQDELLDIMIDNWELSGVSL